MDHLIHPLILFIFLIPYAIQDWRDNRVTNWLTIPAFVVAWLIAIAFNNLPLAALTCFGCYAAWSCGWMGAADGKLATLLAALSPPTLFISTILLALTFSICEHGARPTCMFRHSSGFVLAADSTPFLF